MKISIFGLGYVGAVSCACFAKLGNRVIGVDIIDYKVNSINSGKSPIKEKGLDEIVREQVGLKILEATKNTKDAVLNTDVSFICVGTPPKKNGELDLRALKGVCKQIGKALKEKQNHIIVIRSTMFPGSLNVLKKILQENSGKKSGKDFNLAVNPEFLREGSAIKDFFNPPFIVVGSDNKKTCKKVIEAYEGIDAKKFIVNTDVAQMIKYTSNSFHALKVTFANEISSVCKKIGVDSKKLMGLFCEDNHSNISSYYFKPGFAYGGSCLPKDLAALKNKARRLDIKVPLIDSISKSNMIHMKRAVKLIESKKKKKIGILGLTFKADTDDIRGNPVLYVINRLLNKGYDIKIFDNLIDKSNLDLISKSYRKEVYDLINRENLKEKVNNISKLFSDLNDVLKQDVIVISNRDENLRKYAKNLEKNQILIDLQNIFDKKDTSGKYESL